MPETTKFATHTLKQYSSDLLEKSLQSLILGVTASNIKTTTVNNNKIALIKANLFESMVFSFVRKATTMEMIRKTIKVRGINKSGIV